MENIENKEKEHTFEKEEFMSAIDIKKEWIDFSWLAFRRFFARLLDLFLVTAFCLFILESTFFDESRVFMIIFIFLTIIYESLFIYFFGATIWKKLFWIKILDSNWYKLSFSQSFKRTISSLFLWNIFYIFPLSIISQIYQFSKFLKDWSTTYDKNNNYLIKYKKISILRKILAFFGFCLLIFLNFLLMIYAWSSSKYYIIQKLKMEVQNSEDYVSQSGVVKITDNFVRENWQYFLVYNIEGFNFEKNDLWENSENFINLFKRVWFQNNVMYRIIENWLIYKMIEFEINVKYNFYGKNWEFMWTFVMTPKDLEEMFENKESPKDEKEMIFEALKDLISEEDIFEDEESITKTKIENREWKIFVIYDVGFKNAEKSDILNEKDFIQLHKDEIKNNLGLEENNFYVDNLIKYNISIEQNFYDKNWEFFWSFSILAEELKELRK